MVAPFFYRQQREVAMFASPIRFETEIPQGPVLIPVEPEEQDDDNLEDEDNLDDEDEDDEDDEDDDTLDDDEDDEDDEDDDEDIGDDTDDSSTPS